MMIKQYALGLGIVLVSACAHFQNPETSLYDQIGGKAAITQITDNFIRQIEFDREIFPYFAESNVDRFREKFEEHLCVQVNGPCEYTGDDMLAVHKGMNITEADFNRTVDLLINAMTDANVPHRLQNRILAKLAPMRSEMIYK